MATMATGDDDNDGNDDDGATTTNDVGNGGMGAATGYDDNDTFDGCGVHLPMAAATDKSEVVGAKRDATIK
jgi:hypothetical protein